MNREEILAKSKQENKGIDYVNLETSRNSMQVGWVVILLLLAAAMVVNAITQEKVSCEIGFAMLAGCAVIFGYKYMKLPKKHELIFGVLELALAAVFFVMFVIGLVR